MTDFQTVLVDMRWTEAGWKEVFTSRLLGWLPQKQFEASIAAGHFASDEGDLGTYRLTSGAKAWTDPHDDTEELTLKQLAETLVFLGLDPACIYTIPTGAVRLDERDVFDLAFRAKVLRYLGLEGT